MFYLKMPILLQINVTANWGSTGKIAEQIGLVAQNHGWKSYIAYGRNANPSKNKLIKVGTMNDVYEHFLESLLLDNEGLASRKATKEFLNKVDKLKPDIVHIHNIHDHWLNYELLFCYLAEKKIPTVWTQHDQWGITGHCCYIPERCQNWKERCCVCPVIKWYSLDRSKRNFYLKKRLLEAIPFLAIVTVSKWLAGFMYQSHLKNRYVEVIHNGIDLNVFRPQNHNTYQRYSIDKKKKIVLGVAALWDERKGLKDFYKLSEVLPANDFVIVIVGKVKDQYIQKKENCQIIFIDRTQNALELAQLYTAASVFVNPTYQDNYPTTNLESIACGTPVITYNTGGSPESIDYKTGIVVEQGDIDGLRRGILAFANVKNSDDCRAHAEEMFSDKKCFEAYISLYNKLLNLNNNDEALECR